MIRTRIQSLILAGAYTRGENGERVFNTNSDIYQNLSKFWTSNDTKRCVIDAFHTSFELYDIALDYSVYAEILDSGSMRAHRSNLSDHGDFLVKCLESMHSLAISAMYSLFDQDNNRNFKNIIDLQVYIDQQIPKKRKVSWLHNPVKDIPELLGRIRNSRDKGVSHYEVQELEPPRLNDLHQVVNYARVYIEDFYKIFIGRHNRRLPTLDKRISQLKPGVLSSLVIDNTEDD